MAMTGSYAVVSPIWRTVLCGEFSKTCHRVRRQLAPATALRLDLRIIDIGRIVRLS
jgi:hypothetical protein